jgi:hydrogenase maturation protease
MKIAIVGFGNILMGDDGIGIYAINKLKKDLPKEIDIIDGGTSSFDILPQLSKYDRVIFIDAIDIKDKPGSVHKLWMDDLRVASINIGLTHGIDLLTSYHIYQKLNYKLPKDIVVVGVQVNQVKISRELTIKHAYPKIKNMVLDLINV